MIPSIANVWGKIAILADGEYTVDDLAKACSVELHGQRTRSLFGRALSHLALVRPSDSRTFKTIVRKDRRKYILESDPSSAPETKRPICALCDKPMDEMRPGVFLCLPCYQNVVEELVVYRSALGRIANRRPNTFASSAAFYLSRRDARTALNQGKRYRK